MHHMTIRKTTEYKKEACGIQKQNHMARRELIYTTCMPSMATSINTACVHQIYDIVRYMSPLKKKKKSAAPKHHQNIFGYKEAETCYRKQNNFSGTGSVTPGDALHRGLYSAFK